uniref:Laminin, gamma 2 n=1 Tax=Oreochromis niloticus TaxID=8128 RepID=A0A669BRK1_ORENI
MRNGWISLCGLLFAVCAVQATYRYYSIMRCECNGRSQYCLHDALGLHCVDCQGNTEGRHCERCKDGFYLQGAGQSCSPCRCNPTGSVSKSCDSTGRCSCKEGVTGDKCDRCPNGPIGPDGCPQSRQPRHESESLTLPCFCYGHSSRCSAQSGYSVHKITSTFTTGVEDWKVGTMQGKTPADTHFRWSPKHQDVEVISKNSLPVYLYAPDHYLGNQLLSYGQNLSFSLRLDRGVRYPSVNDVILEGGGLRVAASLGDLRSVVPCGQKITYSFRLDERPGSKWRPQLSALQFQTLLQNLTAIKIRATFGDTGRGYLDNVQLVTAQRGDGVPARWVHTCSCPPGHEGEFCQRCAPGFKRRDPADGAFSPCEPCSCRGGSCDPQTGDCYSADETPADRSCSQGFYRDPRRPETCVRCPCADGVSCSLAPGSLEPRCERCPSGTSGPRCDVCQEGYYGDPLGTGGVQRPCIPCRCNGHIDIRVPGSCDRNNGECLKCVNNTKGRHCEDCVRGFYHRQPTDACKPCNCDVQRSESDQCDASGQCRCRPGFEGLRCQRSSCPACFTPIKAKMAAYAAKLRDLESLFSDMDGGLKPANNAEIEAALTDAMEQVDDMMEDAKQLTKVEKKLQDHLSSISKRQLDEEQDLLNIKDAAADIKLQQQTYKTKMGEVQKLIGEMKVQLEKAKSDLNSADVPQSDSPLGSNDLSSLVTTATNLANDHQTIADTVEKNANKALSDSQQSLTLVRNLMNRENKVKELIGDLKTMYEQTSAQVKAQTELRKTPVSEAKKTPVTQTQTTCSSQFIPIHHPGAFPPLPSRPGFPPSAYVIPSPVAFPGLQVNPGFTFSTGVSVPGPFLQQPVHTQAGTQVQAGKQSHIPYSQQRPSGPGPGQGPGSSGHGPSQAQQGQTQTPSQQALQQSVQLTMSQQQSPTKPVQQVGMGKSPPHHPGLQQYMQVQEQSTHMWNQAQAALQKVSPMQMPIKQPQQQKQQQQAFYMAAQDPLKMYEHQLHSSAQVSSMDKKMKYPDVKLQDFYWDSPYRIGDSLAVLADRMKRPSPGGICSEQDGPAGPGDPRLSCQTRPEWTAAPRSSASRPLCCPSPASPCRSTTRTASSVRPTVKTCHPAPSPTLPWCTRRRPFTRCLKAPRGPPPSPPAQITPRRPASLLTRPILAACRLPLQPTTTEPCLSPTLGPSGLRTTGTAGEWTAGRPTRVEQSADSVWTTCQPRPPLQHQTAAGIRLDRRAAPGPIRTLRWRSRPPLCCLTASR